LGVDVFPSYTTEAGQLGEDPTADLTPLTRAAPWPKGLPTTTDPEDVSAWREQSAEIHATNMGGSREALYLPTLNPSQDEWVELSETDPGLMFPALEPVPNQQKTGGASGWGSRDVVQSNARQNGYGFNAAHMHRRYVEVGVGSGTFPGNYMWMEPGSRPLIRSYAGTANVPVGQDSPFAGQDPGAAWDSQGAVLQNLPSAYQPPGVPALADEPATYSDIAGVDLW
jgi:hypothetical protein